LAGESAPGLFPDLSLPDQSPSTGLFCQVALNRPMRCQYTYAVPEHMAEGLAPGMRVAVPFAGRRSVGVVVGLTEGTDIPAKRIKSVSDVLDPGPLLAQELLDLTEWMAAYYACSWGEALAAVLPAALKREGGRRTTAMLVAEDGVGPEQLVQLEERHPKQYRLLRTLLEVDGMIERKDILRRLGLSDSPAKSLVKRGWVRVENVESAQDDLLGGDASDRTRPDTLTPEQDASVVALEGQLDRGTYATFLLKGVTGSGKTEVYLRAIEYALAQGKGAIVLVPEIALTPQTVGWFRARFGNVAVLHSRMTDVQRLSMWRRVHAGECRVVVGARSAVFAPVPDLGVIVVDEEHEPSFKQGNVPRYHGRDVAVMRARKAGAVCILGSATPSLESWVNAEAGRYSLLELSSRVHGGPMPKVQVVDMRAEIAEVKRSVIFSRALIRRLKEALARGEQGILFLNRRGYSPVLWCRACGETVTCNDCSSPMNLHKRHGRLVCHTCCGESLPPTDCPSCTAPGLRFLGAGSERVEALLEEQLPEARVRRMDSDTMLRREDYEETLAAFGQGEIDLLVGTQMIAKGLDFPRVTVVGIISADSALHLPDFRAAERTFQLVSQVAGRAGRADLEGHIVIQTVAPEHHAIVQASRHDFETFAALEMGHRKELAYPPFGRLIRMVFEDEDEERGKDRAQHCAEVLRAQVAGPGLQVLGPAPAPFSMVRGRHRVHLLMKVGEQFTGADRVRSLMLELAHETGKTRVQIDVDPVGML